MAIRKQPSPGRIPVFASREEEARFWDTHSPLDYPEEFEEVEDLRFARPLNHVLTIRLDARVSERLAQVGRRKGLGSSTLARMWLLERLEGEERNQDAAERSSVRPKGSPKGEQK